MAAPANNSTVKRVRDAIANLESGIRSARLKPLEILFLMVTIIFAGIVAYFYFFEVSARRDELDGLDGRERTAKSRILDAENRKKRLDAQRTNASLIIDSINDFESGLKNREQGTPAIISEVNSLAKQYRVSAGDYNYRVVESEADKPTASGGAASKRDESLLNAYTALGIDTTVVGDYDDLRRLIAAIERSRQFIVIDVISFQGEGDRPGQTQLAVPAGAAPPGMARQPVANQMKPGSVPVSLKIEMETYFRSEAKQ